MSFFLDRSRRSSAHLEWKVRLFAAGATLGVAGMYFGEPWLTGAGIAVLLVGVLLRFLPGETKAGSREELHEERGPDGNPGSGPP